VVKVKDIVHAGRVKVDIDDLVLQRDGLVRIVVVVVITVRVATAKDEAVGEHDDEDGLWERDEDLAVNLEASPTQVEQEFGRETALSRRRRCGRVLRDLCDGRL